MTHADDARPGENRESTKPENPAAVPAGETVATDAPVSISQQLKRWGPLAAIALMFLLIISFGWHNLLLQALIENYERLKTYVDANLVLSVAAFAVVYVVVAALSIPGASILTVLGGFLFGWLLGGITVVVAATLGAFCLFMAAHSAFGDSLQKKAGPFLHKLQKGFSENVVSYLLFLRLVPVFPFWLVNLAPALFNVRPMTFLWTTAVGIIPGTFAYTIVGTGLESVLEAQRAMNRTCLATPGCTVSFDFGALITPQLIAAFAALGVLALIPVVIKAWRRRTHGAQQ